MKVFYDGSYTNDPQGDQWITLAGVAATDAVWAKFEMDWSKMLRRRYPIAPFIHMRKILDDDDPFEPIVGWNLEKKKALVDDAIMLISQMNKAQCRIAWSSINESARLRLQTEGIEMPPDPVVNCAANCVYMTAGVYILNHAPNGTMGEMEPLYLFYDRGEKFLGRFKNKWLEERTPSGRPQNPDNWFDQFADIQEVDLPNHLGLQAADMVAWAHSRSLSDKERPFSYLKEWLIKTVPSSGQEFNEEVLRKLNYRPQDWVNMF